MKEMFDNYKININILEHPLSALLIVFTSEITIVRKSF